MKLRIVFNICFLTTAGFTCITGSAKPLQASGAIGDTLTPLVSDHVNGALGARLDLWRTRRLWRVGKDSFLIDGFIRPPGQHPWQGEHIGKWLHAALLAADSTADAGLNGLLHDRFESLVRAQASNGYLGTYAPEERFYNQAAEGDPYSWDIWTHRYVIYGLLRYADRHDDPAALQACNKAAALLAAILGPPNGDVTRFGTRSGLSSSVLLESVCMLYQKTGDPAHLELAHYILECIERNPNLRITAAMGAGEDVTVPGKGKAYQLMAILLGYLEMYKCTGDTTLLETVIKAWQRIHDDHVNMAGGPWSYAYAPGSNNECFAPADQFHPTCCVETCSTTTWIQLSLSLFRLTGDARYADAAELSIFNQLLGAQSPNGNDWAYHSMLNMPERGYQDAITCCASSGPRALELYARHLALDSPEGWIVNSYTPGEIPLKDGNEPVGRMVLKSRYPFVPQCTIQFELPASRDMALLFRKPVGASDMAVAVNSVPQPLERTKGGLLRIRRVWMSGDTVEATFAFSLRARFQTASDGLRWVGFSWGPLALAQSVVKQTDHPIHVIPVSQESEDGSAWLSRAREKTTLRRTDSTVEEDVHGNIPRAGVDEMGDAPTFELNAHGRILLVPYFLAGADGGGVRTMFPTRRPAQ